MKLSTLTAWLARVGPTLRGAAASRCGTSRSSAKKRPTTGSIWPQCIWDLNVRRRMRGAGEVRKPGRFGGELLCDFAGTISNFSSRSYNIRAGCLLLIHEDQ